MTQDPDTPQGLTIVAWSGDLDRIWPTLILGSTGAAYGMRTTIFFTFWGLFPLVRDDVQVKDVGDDAMTKALARMNPPGMDHLKLSKLNFGGAGAAMMRKVAESKNVAHPRELLDMCVEMGVNLWPCEMTMDLLGIDYDQLVDGVGKPVGAATALSEMATSQINLFI